MVGNVKVLRKIVLDRRYDGLDELQKDDEIHVHAQLAAPFLHRLDDFLHNVRVSTIKKGETVTSNVKTNGYIDALKGNVHSLARMHRRHVGSGQMRMRFHGDRFLRMILADVIVHLLHA